MGINKYLGLILFLIVTNSCKKHNCNPYESIFEGKLKKLTTFTDENNLSGDTTTQFFYYDSISKQLTDIYIMRYDSVLNHQCHLNYLSDQLIELTVFQDTDYIKYYAHINDYTIISFNAYIDLQQSLTEPTYGKFINNYLDTLFMPDMIFDPFSANCTGNPFEKKLINMKLYDFNTNVSYGLDSISYSVINRFRDPCNFATETGKMYVVYNNHDNIGHQIPFQNRYSMIYSAENALIQILNYAGYYFDRPLNKLINSNYDDVYKDTRTEIDYLYQFYPNGKVSQMIFFNQSMPSSKNVFIFEYY